MARGVLLHFDDYSIEVTVGGFVYVGSDDGNVYCLNDCWRRRTLLGLGTGSFEPVSLNKENAGYRIFEALDSNPFGFKSERVRVER